MQTRQPNECTCEWTCMNEGMPPGPCQVHTPTGEDLAVTRTAQLAEAIADSFYGDGLDLSARENPAAVTWSEMPEVRAVQQLRDLHATDRQVRLFLTFVCAMDRARAANLLWKAATEIYRSSPDLFEPTQVAQIRLSDLREVLSSTSVTQRTRTLGRE